MQSIYDQIYDTEQHLKTARREGNLLGELQAQTMLDHMLDTMPRTGQPSDPHGTTAPRT
jgi:hypothetical protein